MELKTTYSSVFIGVALTLHKPWNSISCLPPSLSGQGTPKLTKLWNDSQCSQGHSEKAISALTSNSSQTEPTRQNPPQLQRKNVHCCGTTKIFLEKLNKRRGKAVIPCLLLSLLDRQKDWDYPLPEASLQVADWMYSSVCHSGNYMKSSIW